jgi:hypothetical protein
MIIFLKTKQRPHSFCSSLVFPRLTNGIGGFDMLLINLIKKADKKKESVFPVMLLLSAQVSFLWGVSCATPCIR